MSASGLSSSSYTPLLETDIVKGGNDRSRDYKCSARAEKRGGKDARPGPVGTIISFGLRHSEGEPDTAVMATAAANRK
jgi:hypothetical protein